MTASKSDNNIRQPSNNVALLIASFIKANIIIPSDIWQPAKNLKKQIDTLA